MSHVDYRPGGSAPFIIPASVLAYCPRGAVIHQISGQGKKTYNVGQMFYEPPGAYRVSKTREPDRAGQAAGDDLREKGSTLTTPGKASAE